MFEAEAHIGVGGEMENSVTARHCLRERGQVEIVTLNQFEVRILQRAVKEAALAGGKVIPAHDGFAVFEEPVCQGAADETGGAGDENALHFVW